MVGAAVLFGTTGTAQELGPPGTTPLGVGGMRLVVGGLVLLAAAAAGRRAAWSACRRMPWVVIAGAAGVAVYQVAFFVGTSRSGVAAGTVTALGAGPVAAAVIHAGRTRCWPPRTWWWATLLAIVGVALLVGTSGTEFDATGLAASLTAGVAYAVYATSAGVAITAGADPIGAMAALFAAGALVLLPLTLSQPLVWVTTPRGVVLALHLGVVTIAVAYTLYGWGLARLPVATAVTLTLAEPLTATLLGRWVLDQPVGAAGWVGVAVVGLSLTLLGRSAVARG